MSNRREFDPKNVNHRMFIVSASYLRARIFGIHENLGYREAQILNFAEGVEPPEFVVSESVKIAANEEEAKSLVVRRSKCLMTIHCFLSF